LAHAHRFHSGYHRRVWHTDSPQRWGQLDMGFGDSSANRKCFAVLTCRYAVTSVYF
jgi:hypothetical protein